MTAAAVIVLRLVTAPAAIEMWDQRGEPLPITWRTDGRIEVPRLPGAVSVRCYDPDAGAVKFRLTGGGKWWSGKVECGEKPFYLELPTEKCPVLRRNRASVRSGGGESGVPAGR